MHWHDDETDQEETQAMTRMMQSLRHTHPQTSANTQKNWCGGMKLRMWMQFVFVDIRIYHLLFVTLIFCCTLDLRLHCHLPTKGNTASLL